MKAKPLTDVRLDSFLPIPYTLLESRTESLLHSLLLLTT